MSAVRVDLARPGNESPEHWQAKLGAAAYAARRGLYIVGFEVILGRWVVDVAAVRWRGARDPEVWFIEAKGHRADWLRELAAVRRFESAREELAAIPPSDGRLARRAPQPLDLTIEERKRRRKLGRIASRFPKLLSPKLEQLASRRLIYAPAGVVKSGELINGWGLVENDRQKIAPAESASSVEAFAAVSYQIARGYAARMFDGDCWLWRNGKTWPAAADGASRA